MVFLAVLLIRETTRIPAQSALRRASRQASEAAAAQTRPPAVAVPDVQAGSALGCGRRGAGLGLLQLRGEPASASSSFQRPLLPDEDTGAPWITQDNPCSQHPSRHPSSRGLFATWGGTFAGARRDAGPVDLQPHVFSVSVRLHPSFEAAGRAVGTTPHMGEPACLQLGS